MPPRRPLRVLVAGGGFAAAEAILALRALAGERVTLELVTPDPTLAFRPATTASPFTGAPVERFELDRLAERTGARLTVDSADAVAPDVQRVRLRSGGVRDYDALLLALGARARAGVPGALTIRDQRDGVHLDRLVRDLRDGALRSLVLCVPAGVSWSLPAVELALLCAAEAADAGQPAAITLVTPEREPLEVFGDAAAAAVGSALAERGVRVVRGTPRLVDHRGLRLADGGTVQAERIVAAPALNGRRIVGVPANFGGFVTTDRSGRVAGVGDVFAAGDMTAFPVKQGGLAAQQAEAAARVIAASAGAEVEPGPQRFVLRAQLFGAPEPLWLRADLDLLGRPVPGTSVVADEPLWWPASTLFGRHLSPWLAAEHAIAA